MNKYQLYTLGGALLAAVALSGSNTAAVSAEARDGPLIVVAGDHADVAANIIAVSHDVIVIEGVSAPAFQIINRFNDVTIPRVVKASRPSYRQIGDTFHKAMKPAPRGGAAVPRRTALA